MITEITDTTARIAISGGTGFVGSALAAQLKSRGHDVVLLSRRTGVSLDDRDALVGAFAGCDAVAHLAGINRELGSQTYDRVHVQGTANVIAAAKATGVRRIVMLSFLRARPNCGSPYHESKWRAEELIRASGLDYTIIKAGVIYGRGDHLLDHLSHALFTLPLFATVGMCQPSLRPVHVRDVANVLATALLTDRLNKRTVAVVGPEILTMRRLVERVAAATGRRTCIVPMPVAFHCLLAGAAERTMHVPLVSLAQVRILQEGLAAPAAPTHELPSDLAPAVRFTVATICDELPPSGPFRRSDFRCCATSSRRE